MAWKNDIGRWGEDRAAEYMEQHGWYIRHRNWQKKHHELDLVCIDENSTILLIEEYIGENYMKEGLSVKDISAHVFLSASYVCTVFKNETGKTLSQYITDYRMEKAKRLLADPRYRISDISSQVGYSDGNYFGKSFKKHTGMTPSEYRERITG